MLIEAFPADKPPKNLCARSVIGTTNHRHDQEPADERERLKDYHECMTSCADCGEAWVLLGCFELTNTSMEINTEGRKYVKPIECARHLEPAPRSTAAATPAGPARALSARRQSRRTSKAPNS